MGQAKSAKKKPSSSSGSPRSYSEVYKNSAAGVTAPVAPTAGGAATAAVVDAPSAGAEFDWMSEYGYVAHDLKRLGIITGIIAGAIIVIGFFV